MDILRSIDIEDTVRKALLPYMECYCPPLPSGYVLPSVLVRQVGGSEAKKIDTFTVTLDARASTEAEASETLRSAVGILMKTATDQTTAIRFVVVNSSGSWGSDPVRPDLAMYSATLQITAHQETYTLTRRVNNGK